MIKRKDVTILTLALVCVGLLTLAQVLGVGFLILGALVCYLAFMITAKDEYTIPLFLFFLPWSAILKMSPESISFYSVATIFVFLFKLLSNFRSKFSAVLIIPVLGLTLLSLVAKFLNGYGIALSYFMFIGMMLAFPLLLKWTGDKVKFEVCITYYSVGIIVATIVSLIFEGNSNLNAYVTVFEDATIVVRHCGFYGDPNFFAAQVITAIGGQLLIINEKTRQKFCNIVFLLSLIACGFVSLSKSYLICLVVVLACWLICQVQKGAGGVAKALLGISVVVAVVLASGAFSDTIDQYIFRFDVADDTAALTTGRSELWEEYFVFFENNPMDLLLGQGYTSVFKEGVHKGSHNTLIQCVYQFGLIGCAFFIVWLAVVMTCIGVHKSKKSSKLLLIVCCFSMWLGLDILFFDDLFLTIIIFALGLRYSQVDAPCSSKLFIGDANDVKAEYNCNDI